MSGSPWDTDGIDACPPDGDDDVRCEWLTEHAGHADNGVLAAIMDGATTQSATFLSDVWPDPINSGNVWWVNYDVHFAAVDSSDLTDLLVTTRYQHNGTTFLTLNLGGPAAGGNYQYVLAPTHFWNETPETGTGWRIRLTLTRTQPGQPAMIWVDNIHVTEGATTLFQETFPLKPGDVDGNGAVGVEDLVLVIVNWGACPDPPEPCTGDINESGAVDVNDLLLVVLGWG